MRVEMNDLREKMRNNERNAMQNDDEIGRLKHELELEQGENGKILAQREDLSRQLDLLRAENLSQSSRISHLEKDVSSGYIFQIVLKPRERKFRVTSFFE